MSDTGPRAEEALVYVRRILAEQEPLKRLARMLAKRVWEKGTSCCACTDRSIRLWTLETERTKGKRGLIILAKLFCKQHEERWKRAEYVEYDKFNGVMLVGLPYYMPVGMWIDMRRTWRRLVIGTIWKLGVWLIGV